MFRRPAGRVVFRGIKFDVFAEEWTNVNGTKTAVPTQRLTVL